MTQYTFTGSIVALVVLLGLAAGAQAGPRAERGLSAEARAELQAAGGTKYLGQFIPGGSVEIGDGWTEHSFDSDGGDGPICIDGSSYSVFSRPGNPRKLLIFLQGGGACWQDFYFCSTNFASQRPPAPRVGIWDFDSPDNPFADYSVVYLPYCDGSVFAGDNAVVDGNFPAGPVRHHRGLRNQSAGIDLAGALFPKAKRITLAGASAGGVGVAGTAPFTVRMVFGNKPRLTVINDAGPVAIDLSNSGAIAQREADWQFGQFFPASCTMCDPLGQPTAIIDWRLANDSTIREGFYSADGDSTDRFFLGVPTQELYRELIVSEHGALNAAYPERYKRFIVSGSDAHTALQFPRFYTDTVEGVSLNEWVGAMVGPRRKQWVDLVQEFIPLP